MNKCVCQAVRIPELPRPREKHLKERAHGCFAAAGVHSSAAPGAHRPAESAVRAVSQLPLRWGCHPHDRRRRHWAESLCCSPGTSSSTQDTSASLRSSARFRVLTRVLSSVLCRLITSNIEILDHVQKHFAYQFDSCCTFFFFLSIDHKGQSVGVGNDPYSQSSLPKARVTCWPGYPCLSDEHITQ